MQSIGYFYKKFCGYAKIVVPVFLGLAFCMPVSNCVWIVS